MVDVRESSGLKSLASLREHERRQIQQADAARARAEAEQRARLESEREQARAERERQRIERVSSEAAESQRRAELDRLEIARVAELERAERAARGREELELRLAEERGSRRSAELVFTAQLLRQRTFACLSAALCIASWLGGAALYFGALRPAAERAELAGERALADERTAHALADEAGARSTRRSDELSRRVSALEEQLRERPGAVSGAPAGAPQKAGPKPAHGTNAAAPPCRDDGDPLNPCLKR
jgi:hypothetical protein